MNYSADVPLTLGVHGEQMAVRPQVKGDAWQHAEGRQDRAGQSYMS